jgi:bifunctional non-homologous end joining protein LigD
MPSAPDRQAVAVDGRRLVLSNLDRVIFPATGDTKAHLLHYYAQAAPALLRYGAGRPASFVRAPDGPGGQRWFAKRPPGGTPSWLTTADIGHSGGGTGEQRHVVLDSVASVVAMANLGAFEIHVPQWTVAGGREAHDRLVLDLDPGEGAGLALCCRVAVALRDLLAEDGLTAFPVLSGGKGLHLYVPLRPTPARATSAYARALGGRVAAVLPGLVLVAMARGLRTGKVFVDWSQNASAKTTACPYTLRVRDPGPGVAAPLTWDEVAAMANGARPAPAFTPPQVLRRLAEHGDVLGPLTTTTGRATLPSP